MRASVLVLDGSRVRLWSNEVLTVTILISECNLKILQCNSNLVAMPHKKCRDYLIALPVVLCMSLIKHFYYDAFSHRGQSRPSIVAMEDRG